jgi:uncharacterized protein (TIGR00251 family)
MADAERPWRATPEGVRLAVRVTPRGGRDAIDGIAMMADGHSVVKLRVRVAPEDGEANRAAVKLLAKTLGVAARDVRVVAGETARLKQIAVDGDAATLTARLVALCGETPDEDSGAA